VIRSGTAPDIARATALVELVPYLGPASIGVVAQSLQDSAPVVRAAALRTLESAPVKIRKTLAFGSLNDPVRGVRIEAARILAPTRAGDLSSGQRSL